MFSTSTYLSCIFCHSSFDFIALCPSRSISLILKHYTKDEQCFKKRNYSFLNYSLFPEFSCPLFSWSHGHKIHPRRSHGFSSTHSTTITYILNNTLSLGLIHIANVMPLSLGFKELPSCGILSFVLPPKWQQALAYLSQGECSFLSKPQNTEGGLLHWPQWAWATEQSNPFSWMDLFSDMFPAVSSQTT